MILLQEDYVDNSASSDGYWAGVKYFTCKPQRGKFAMLKSLKPDQRLTNAVLPSKTCYYGLNPIEDNMYIRSCVLTFHTQLHTCVVTCLILKTKINFVNDTMAS